MWTSLRWPADRSGSGLAKLPNIKRERESTDLKQAGAPLFSKGDKVTAKWEDGKSWPAIIVRGTSTAKGDVRYPSVLCVLLAS
jgi:hypothetical protein